MKTIAIFLLLTFSGTILLPLALSLTQQNKVSLFVVDEEKSNNNNQLTEIKEQKKDLSKLLQLPTPEATGGKTPRLGDGSSSLLPPSPYLEYVAPPPNFC